MRKMPKKRPTATSTGRTQKREQGQKGATLSQSPSSDVSLGPIFRSKSRTYRLTEIDALKSAAMRWTYVVRNRRRWRTLKDGVERQDERARTFLIEDVRVPQETLDALAGDGAVEVAVSFETETQGWEQRIFPWEFVISAATRSRQKGP